MPTQMPRFHLLQQLALPRWHEQAYEKVSSGDSDGFALRQNEGKNKWMLRARSFLVGGAITSVAFLCILVIIWWPSRLLHTHNESLMSAATDNVLHHCGDSVEEAQQLGCTWDSLAAAWLPPACIDQELTDEFRAQHNWTYFADKKGNEPLMEEELKYRIGKNATYFTSLRYHRTHCNFQWRKMHRAWERGTWIESALARYHHTKHCGFVGLQTMDLEDLATEISVEFMTCYPSYPYGAVEDSE
ncbi:MAG: hypothetical protein Q9164_003673 [Protoblastenia rupestris]